MDIQALIAKMTLAEKAAQMTQFAAFMMEADGIAITGPMQYLGVTQEDLDTCGSMLNMSTPESRVELQKQHMEKDPNHIPLVLMQDVIHGFRTIYPIPLAMAASFDPDLMQECAAMAAREAAASGVDVTFAPMVDMSRDARWGRVMEGTGEDKLLGCLMAAAQVKGFIQEGLEACVKHYAGYGAPEAGRDYNTVDMSEERMREHYLPAYKAAIDAGARLIMPSFNSMNGVPSVANKLLMRKILREEWGFDGVVVSDYAAVIELMRHGVAEDEMQAAQLALEAGCDLEMMSACYLHGLQKLLDEGRITMDQVDECVERLLRLKEEMGLFEHPEGKADRAKYDAVELCPEHRALACRAAEQSAVLLKNDGLLPLSDKVKKVAVIGPFAQDGQLLGSWSINGKEEEAVTILKGIQERMPGAEIRTCAGCSWDLITNDLSGIQEAVDMAAWADQTILVIGERGSHSGESNSRAILELSDAQLALVKAVTEACADTAVLLMAGRPLAIPEVDAQARAILCMWQPGTEGGTAAARLLYGDVSPVGHLPMTFPRATGQEPISYDIYSTGRGVADPANSMQNMYQSHYLDVPVAPLYPFGHGLTYTTFTLKDAALSAESMTKEGSLEASVTLCNTGDREGTALVQLYIHDLVGSVVRPVRELKDFRRVSVKPGEEVRVTFTVSEEMLRFQTLDKGYASEPGAFEAILALDAQSGEVCRFRLI